MKFSKDIEQSNKKAPSKFGALYKTSIAPVLLNALLPLYLPRNDTYSVGPSRTITLSQIRLTPEETAALLRQPEFTAVQSQSLSQVVAVEPHTFSPSEQPEDLTKITERTLILSSEVPENLLLSSQGPAVQAAAVYSGTSTVLAESIYQQHVENFDRSTTSPKLDSQKNRAITGSCGAEELNPSMANMTIISGGVVEGEHSYQSIDGTKDAYVNCFEDKGSPETQDRFVEFSTKVDGDQPVTFYMVVIDVASNVALNTYKTTEQKNTDSVITWNANIGKHSGRIRVQFYVPAGSNRQSFKLDGGIIYYDQYSQLLPIVTREVFPDPPQIPSNEIGQWGSLDDQTIIAHNHFLKLEDVKISVVLRKVDNKVFYYLHYPKNPGYAQYYDKNGNATQRFDIDGKFSSREALVGSSLVLVTAFNPALLGSGIEVGGVMVGASGEVIGTILVVSAELLPIIIGAGIIAFVGYQLYQGVYGEQAKDISTWVPVQDMSGRTWAVSKDYVSYTELQAQQDLYIYPAENIPADLANSAQILSLIQTGFNGVNSTGYVLVKGKFPEDRITPLSTIGIAYSEIQAELYKFVQAGGKWAHAKTAYDQSDFTQGFSEIQFWNIDVKSFSTPVYLALGLELPPSEYDSIVWKGKSSLGTEIVITNKKIEGISFETDVTAFRSVAALATLMVRYDIAFPDQLPSGEQADRKALLAGWLTAILAVTIGTAKITGIDIPRTERRRGNSNCITPVTPELIGRAIFNDPIFQLEEGFSRTALAAMAAGTYSVYYNKPLVERVADSGTSALVYIRFGQEVPVTGENLGDHDETNRTRDHVMLDFACIGGNNGRWEYAMFNFRHEKSIISPNVDPPIPMEAYFEAYPHCYAAPAVQGVLCPPN